MPRYTLRQRDLKRKRVTTNCNPATGMGTPHDSFDRPIRGTPVPPPGEIINDLSSPLTLVAVSGAKREELNEGDNTLQYSTGPIEMDNLWEYDEKLLMGRDFPCDLKVVPQKFNDMKMFSVLLVKFKCPFIKQNKCIRAVKEAYGELVDRWMKGAQEHDAIAFGYAQMRLKGLSLISVRKEMNALLEIASETWGIPKKQKFSFKTFRTPDNRGVHETQETLDMLKAAIVKNAKERHEKHKAKAPSSCKSLLDAVRPDKVAEYVIHHLVTRKQSLADSLNLSDSMFDSMFEESNEVQRMLDFSSVDETVSQAHHFDEFFPPMDIDMHDHDFLSSIEDIQPFEPWELEELLS